MPRPLRITYEGAVYHVMNRGTSRQLVFNSDEDYRHFLVLISETVKMWGIIVHAFSLMPNHYHLLIETPRANISRAMRHIDGVYTQRYNRARKRDGQLFRGRYKAILVEEDAYLVELLRYIHLNPVEAGIVSKPEDHMWTSHKYYIGDNPFTWLSTDRLLGYFGKRKNLSRMKLHDFVLDGVPEDLRRQLDGARWPSVFSSEHFKEWVKWNFVKDEELKNGNLQYVEVGPKGLKEEQLREIVCRVLDVKWNRLCAACGRDDKKKRRLAVRCFSENLEWSYGRLSKTFGGMHFSNISRCVRGKWINDEPLWERLVLEIQNEKRKT